MKVVAFLPTKGNSERIESKNMKLMDGKPLFLHTLEKLCSCDFIDEVYLDSESDEILSYASHLDYKALKRDPELASNKTDGHQLFYNEVAQVEADFYIQILGTNPFVKEETIEKGLNILMKHSEYDSVVLVKKEKQYLWSGNQPVYDKNHVPNSFDLPDTITETMGLYIVRKECALKEKKRFGNNCYLLEANPIEAIDINYSEDFKLAELIAKGERLKEVTKLRSLATMLTSPMLSDIMFDCGLKGVITGFKPNFKEIKILGRANTLKIRKLHEGEDFRGIYDALKTYESIGLGEIIMVENEVTDRAYFGDLNANLAVRSGAAGAIIGGVTRDAVEVSKLGFPVFSKGYCCADVRGMATMESYGKPIEIQGVTIQPGDLIFADCNGIVVIPKKWEETIINKAMKTIRTEKSVLDKVYSGKNALSIYQEEGAF
ncbi:MAG: cytidyltransferase [Defluviitaleaceae bacterium]|nr:cytidyltransferase [Defluviitaleaceae bacterium]